MSSNELGLFKSPCIPTETLIHICCGLSIIYFPFLNKYALSKVLNPK